MSPEAKLKVLLVDDHPLFRSGLRMLLESSDARLSVTEASSLADAFAMTEAGGVDVVVLEVTACEGDVIEVIARMVGDGELPVLMFSKQPYNDSMVPALQAGACGYVPDTKDVTVFLESIRRAAAGEYILDSDLAKRVVLKLRELARVPRQLAVGREREGLSERETEILTLVAQGLTNRQVSVELGISESTVKNHLNSIFRKLQVSSRGQASVEGMRRGVVAL